MGLVIPGKLFKILKGCEQYDVIKKKESISCITERTIDSKAREVNQQWEMTPGSLVNNGSAMMVQLATRLRQQMSEFPVVVRSYQVSVSVNYHMVKAMVVESTPIIYE